MPVIGFPSVSSEFSFSLLSVSRLPTFEISLIFSPLLSGLVSDGARMLRLRLHDADAISAVFDAQIAEVMGCRFCAHSLRFLSVFILSLRGIICKNTG